MRLNANTRITLAVLCAFAGTFAIGCGQTISVRVVRVKQIAPSDSHPVTLARNDARVAAEQLAGAIELINRLSGGKATALASDAKRAKEIAETLEKAMPISRVAVLSNELLTIAAPIRSNRQFFADFAGDADMKQQVQTAINELDNLAANIAITRQTALRLADQAAFGGFHDNSVARLDPYSSAYDGLKSEGNKGEMEFASVNVELVGKTGVMLVQESPTHFERRSIVADPTEVIRNTLVIINKVLQVVSRFIPALSGVADAVPGGGVSSASAGAATPDGGASSSPNTNYDELLRLAADPDFMRALEKRAAGTASDAEKSLVDGKLAALRRGIDSK